MDKKNFVTLRFCIPAVGARVVLAEPWTFKLYYEHRNDPLLLRIRPPDVVVGACGKRQYVCGECRNPTNADYGSDDYYKSSMATIPAGTKLTIDRIYLRKPSSRFDSITFRIAKNDCPDKSLVGARFWAKLRDVNRIVCLPVGDSASLAEFESFLCAGKSFADEGDRFDFLM